MFVIAIFRVVVLITDVAVIVGIDSSWLFMLQVEYVVAGGGQVAAVVAA